MTTEILTEDIPIYLGFRLVGGFAPNIYLKNTGTGTLDATLIFSLYQHLGLGNENIINFQCWVRNGITPTEEININGNYFLSDSDLDLISSELNKDDQTLRMRINVTGGASEADRTALVKQTYTDVIDYSLIKSNI